MSEHSQQSHAVTAIVVDIEGTVSPVASVRALYDYTYQHLPEWLSSGDRYAQRVIALTRSLSGQGDAGVAEVTQILQAWLKADVKAEPLKLAQGLICHEGFRSGELHGEFFPDVAPALILWHAAGVELCVYSSGSVENQQDWFGKLKGLIDRWFDLTTGSKLDHTSYVSIAAELNRPADEILFLTDHPGELDAAAEAGWKIIGVRRAGQITQPPHRWVNSLAEINLGWV